MVDSTNLPEVDINQIATDLNGKMDKDGVNATASVCIESWHDENGNWYRVYSDGWCEQGGFYGGTISQSSYTIPLLKAYANANYTLNITAEQTTDVTGCTDMTSKQRTTTSFIAMNGGSSFTGGFMWEAKGYIR
jgi:hypothetical protein